MPSSDGCLKMATQKEVGNGQSERHTPCKQSEFTVELHAICCTGNCYVSATVSVQRRRLMPVPYIAMRSSGM